MIRDAAAKQSSLASVTRSAGLGLHQCASQLSVRSVSPRYYTTSPAASQSWPALCIPCASLGTRYVASVIVEVAACVLRA